MSIRGVLQLSKLTLNYCRIGGSSRGMRWVVVSLRPQGRLFIEEELPKLKHAYPTLEIDVAQKNGHHPFVVGEYGGCLSPQPLCDIIWRTYHNFKRYPSRILRRYGRHWVAVCVHGNVKEVTCRNEDPKEIMRQINFLRGQYGMPVKKIAHRQRTRRPSIQGGWSPDTEINVTLVP
eukprot:1105968-Prorocentrum_minimum.AAC.2